MGSSISSCQLLKDVACSKQERVTWKPPLLWPVHFPYRLLPCGGSRMDGGGGGGGRGVGGWGGEGWVLSLDTQPWKSLFQRRGCREAEAAPSFACSPSGEDALVRIGCYQQSSLIDISWAALSSCQMGGLTTSVPTLGDCVPKK